MHPAAHGSSSSSAPPLIMIVDDVPDNREMYATFLSRSGLRVVQASTTDEAWRQIRREPPQVVVTDLAMPGLDGYELCRKIREQRTSQQTGIITLTGLTLKQSDIERLIDAGSDRLLLKPCLPSTLLSEIRQVLAYSHVLRLQAHEHRTRAKELIERSTRLQEWSANLQRQLSDWRKP
jgi:CheY-like chemotaxis protein